MKSVDGVGVLEVSASVMGAPRLIHPTLIRGEERALLVDTGFPGGGTLAALSAELQQAGLSLNRLTGVIITHQDIDHIGGLPGIVEATQGKVEILAHEAEKPYLQGERRLIKLPAEGAASSPAWPPEWRETMTALLESLPKLRVSRCVADGEELPYGGGTIAIHTPGHTPGHLSLYVKRPKVLIAGDALNVEEGKLIGPRSQFTADLAAALKSVEKLARYDIETVICYHGGIYSADANRRIAEIAQGA